MKDFCILILVAFFVTNSLDKAESVKLDEKPHKIIDEIFGEGWWDNGKADEWDKLTLGQIDPNSTDQNPPLTESDHFDNANSSENIAEDERKRKIIDKFLAIKDEFKQKRKYSKKEWVQIDKKIAKHLKVNRSKIYKWKKEFGLSQFYGKEERKHLIEKFDQMKVELKREGFQNSYPHQIDETVARELCITYRTIYAWKRKHGQTKPYNQNSKSEQKELMQLYYEIKGQNPKNSDADIAKMLKIGARTLCNWKKQFERQKLDPNSVGGHFVEENAAANIQEIDKSNAESI